jgi:hypothetical protein
MSIRDWAHRQAREYRNGNERPLRGYVTLLGVYVGGSATAAVAGKALGRSLPERISPWDVAQLAITTHKLGRIIAKDPVTSPLRAPFTRYEGLSAAGELSEEVRGHGLSHSVGELLTCPMCLAQWLATGFGAGLVIAPATTRLAMAIFTAVGGADFLQHAYAALQQASEG